MRKVGGKILLLLNDKKLREKLAKKAKEIAEKNFSKQKITKDLEGIYESLINKKTKLRLMRKVSVVVRTEEPIEELWDLMIDINKWDKLIKFVREISIKEPVKEGTQFYDITGIMWFPTHIKHRITKIEKYKKFSMETYLPLKNGKMFQTIEMNKTGKFADISIEIKFYIRFSLFDLISGPILERRLKRMLVETVKKVENEARRKKIGKGKGIRELITK